MSGPELDRFELVARLDRGELRQSAVAKPLELSVRQVQRLLARFRVEGPARKQAQPMSFDSRHLSELAFCCMRRAQNLALNRNPKRSDMYRVLNISPYSDDVLKLPVASRDEAKDWYMKHFGFDFIRESDGQVILAKDGVEIGFAETGKDPSVEGASIAVDNIQAARDDLEAREVNVVNWRVDERDGQRFQVFFVVAPDGLCFYFNQLIS